MSKRKYSSRIFLQQIVYHQYLEKSRYFLISFEEKCAILEKKKKGVLEHGECL